MTRKHLVRYWRTAYAVFLIWLGILVMLTLLAAAVLPARQRDVPLPDIAQWFVYGWAAYGVVVVVTGIGLGLWWLVEEVI